MNETEKYVREKLFSFQDKEYLDFNSKLIPNVAKSSFIGVRTPDIRKIAKELVKSGKAQEYISVCEHTFFEEYSVHGSVISDIKDYDEAVKQLDRFLPYVNNWAICDTIKPVCFKKNTDRLITDVKRWLKSGDVYTVRFAVGCLMSYYLGENFKPEYAQLVCEIKSDEYYINMMNAWYFATALCKNYEEVIGYIEDKRLSEWVHNKTISKACDSYRISDEKKDYLRGMRIKKKSQQVGA